MALIGLSDANNFYVSCERSFNSALDGRPVGVLSNNDGCIIARSNELKPLVDMGAAVHLIPSHIRKKIVLLSSNYPLYGDMSRRVNALYRDNSAGVIEYSIDESFLDFDGFTRIQLEDHVQVLRQLVGRGTGIPISIGVSSSKVLAKVATKIAKKVPGSNGFMYLDPGATSTTRLLEQLAPSDLWGISGRLESRLRDVGISNALSLREACPRRIRKHFSVVLERLVHELRGTSCISVDEMEHPRKNIMTSRTFGRELTCPFAIREALRRHAFRGAEKLRRQGSCACAVVVSLGTNRHKPELPQYHPSLMLQLPEPTNDVRLISETVNRGFKQIFSSNYRYQRAGVMLTDLVASESKQNDLLDTEQDERRRERNDRLMGAVDSINTKFGRGSVLLGGASKQAGWQIRAAHLTPRYTTNWAEIPVAKT